MIKKILKSKWSLLIMLVCWLLLLWSRTFIGLANGCETSAFDVLKTSVLMLFFTFIWGCNLFLWDDEMRFFYKDDELQEKYGEDDAGEKDGFCEKLSYRSSGTTDGYNFGLSTSLCAVLVLAVICMFSFAMTGWTEWLNLFNDSTYMQIGWWNINKKYIFDVLMLIVFPAWSTFILRKVKESGFSITAVCFGSVQILALTLMGFLLYMRRPNIWLVEMVIVNVVTLILIVRSYIWKDIRKKGNVAALLILYMLLWLALLSMFYYNGQSITEYMGLADSSPMNSYFTNVSKIIGNASFTGQSLELVNDPYVLQFLEDSHYLLTSILFYAGWLPAILLMAVELVFIIASAGVIVQNQRHDGRDTILQTILFGLFIRVVGGILYSFGIPIPILLPFTGSVGVATDTICIGILILSFLSSRFEDYSDLIAEEILEDLEEEDDDEEYDE
ncbi:MAG: hypothetical protein HFH13_07420 [Dorea sp.]|nr:hypothetical protein [Dorea sp.]